MGYDPRASGRREQAVGGSLVDEDVNVRYEIPCNGSEEGIGELKISKETGDRHASDGKYEVLDIECNHGEPIVQYEMAEGQVDGTAIEPGEYCEQLEYNSYDTNEPWEHQRTHEVIETASANLADQGEQEAMPVRRASKSKRSSGSGRRRESERKEYDDYK